MHGIGDDEPSFDPRSWKRKPVVSEGAAPTARAGETAAAIVRSQLTDQSRVSIEGFGDSQPIAPNTDATGKALNRRVEIVIPRGE